MKDGGPAFPVAISNQGTKGMTLRQFYKAHAPACPEWFRPQDLSTRDFVWPSFWADHLLAEDAAHEAGEEK